MLAVFFREIHENYAGNDELIYAKTYASLHNLSKPTYISKYCPESPQMILVTSSYPTLSSEMFV